MKIVAVYLTGLMLVMATYILGAMILGVVGFYVGGIGLVIFSLYAIVDGFKRSNQLNATLFALSCAVLLASIGLAAAYSMSFAAANPGPLDLSTSTTADFGWSGSWRWWADLTAANLVGIQQFIWVVVTLGWLFGGAFWSYKAYEQLIEYQVDAPSNFIYASIIATWGLTGGSLVGWLLGGLTWVGYDFIHG